MMGREIQSEDFSILSPSQVSSYIKVWMDRDRLLSSLSVRGELSNYKVHSASGHHYFTLKDKTGALKCMMYENYAKQLDFHPQNGMQVIAQGRVSIYVRDGQYQLYCSRLTLEGTGDLHATFEQLKQKLFQAGLFDPRHKKPLPAYPSRIALITSPVGAAVQDMLRILNARYPVAQIYIMPVLVQGKMAAPEIAAAIRWANYHQVADLILTGRGGGSIEDLWAFNEEAVAWAIYESKIPVISAVGHEPDVTISDLVADLRAATPSNAAELAVPDQNELRAWLISSQTRMKSALKRLVVQRRRDLNRLINSRPMSQPESVFRDRWQYLDSLSQRLEQGLIQLLGKERTRLAAFAASLDAMSPMKVLSRGYAIAQKQDEHLVLSTKDLAPKEPFSLRLSDGAIRCIAAPNEE